jgi:acyl-CoA thioesterase FadM
MTEAFLFLPMKSKGLIVNIAIDWAELDLFGHVNNVAFFRYLQKYPSPILPSHWYYCIKRNR